jgi:hypothetical protein
LAAFRNRYWLGDLKGGFTEITARPEDDEGQRARYFLRALLWLEENTPFSGFDFVIVSQGTEALPVQGPNVIAIITNDDHFRMPLFSGKVGMVFKTLGKFPNVERQVRFDRLQLVLLLRVLRSALKHLASRLQVLKSGTLIGAPTRVIPIGDRDLVNLQPLPVNERPYDVSFIGSMQMLPHGKLSIQSLLGTPKAFARNAMVEALEAYQRTRPNSRIFLETKSDFAQSQNAGPLHFSEVLAPTKICVSPRGSCPETYRTFQGARYGCVLIAEELPRRWYYDDMPAFTVARWSELPPLLDRLLADPALMQERSAASLNWWRNVVSEAALGRHLAREIATTFPSQPALAAA